MRTLNALLVRDFNTAYGRSPLGVAWAIAEPVIGIVLLTAVFSQISSVPPMGTSYPVFYATGYLPFLLFTSVQGRVMSAPKQSSQLLSHASLSVIDVIAARALLQSIVMGAVTLIVYAGVWVFCDPQETPDVGGLILAGAAACSLGVAIGVLNSGLASFFPPWEKAWGVITRPLFLISGVFYPFSAMPPSLQNALWWNPILHLVGANREAVYAGYDASYVSPTYVMAVVMGSACVGLALLLTARR